MGASSDGVRTPRADARRNRDRLLAVAEEHFRKHGVTGSLDQIAKEAGVGPGTLYRHFPTRDSLIADLLTAREEELSRQLDELRANRDDAAVALDRWLAILIDWATAFDGLPDSLRDALNTTASPLAVACEGFITATDEFLAAAQRAGSARRQARGRDLFLVVLAVSAVSGATIADASSPLAMLDLLRNGWGLPASG